MLNEVTKLKISRECMFPIVNIAHVRLRKTFYHISVNFPDFVRFQSPENRFLFLEPVRPLVLHLEVENIGRKPHGKM